MNPENRDPRIGLDNNGNIVVKNRTYRRKRKNTAELENRKSKHFYTKRRKNGRKTKRS